MTFKQALSESRKLDTKWIEGGFELIGEKAMSEVLDIYPLIEVDISVTITIKLPNKIYVAPLSDVSSISVNDCLVIGVSDLYTDWEERILNNLGELLYETKALNNFDEWYESKYIGKDGNSRIVRLKDIPQHI